MDRKMFSVVAGVIFAVVALFHLVRIYMWLPMWASWIGLVVAGGLAFFRVETCRARCTLKRVGPPE